MTTERSRLNDPHDAGSARARAGRALTHTAPLIIGCAALTVGSIAAVAYAYAGLTLSHYDARAHLVVARRILDSLTPGWQQIGGIWLPLPHLLNMLPVQVDGLYRTGASAVALSVISTGIAAWALSRFVLRLTGSVAGGAAGAALLLANPNLLYIQSTPMTEPMLLATTLLALTLIGDWVSRGAVDWPHAAGLALAASCLTRYEAWLIAVAAVALTTGVLLRGGSSAGHALRAAMRLASYPTIAIALFSANSRWTVGLWLLPRDFFVPENEALGQPWLAWDQVRQSLYQLSGTAFVWSAYVGLAIVALTFVVSRRRSPAALILALAAAAALPWYSYLHGHPLRVRYAVPLVAAGAAVAGTGIGLLWRPLRALAAIGLIVAVLFQTSPLDRNALLISESQRDATNRAGRASVSAYLQAQYRGGPIMISMGSLAHYMHDLGQHGFNIHHFLHEGNGEAWRYAVLGPAGYVEWIVIEEHAEGGDALFQASKRDARYLDGFRRVVEGGGVALYRRTRIGSVP